jgi:hypothetical protein
VKRVGWKRGLGRAGCAIAASGALAVTAKAAD